MLNESWKLARHLIVPLVVIATCALWIRREHRDAEQRLSEADADRTAYRNDDEAAWSETIHTVDDIYGKLEFWQEPLTLADWHHLRQSSKYLRRRLESAERSPPLTREQRLGTLKYLARVSFAIRQFSETENVIREILSLAESMSTSGVTDIRVTALQADALNWHSCLLANYGDLEEARTASGKSTAVSQALLEETTDGLRVQMALALSRRNGGIIEELLGIDGAIQIEQAAHAAERALATPGEVPLHQRIRTLVFLADTYQAAGFVHVRRNRPDAAKTAWLKCRSFCEQVISVITKANTADDIVPSHRRFVKAIERLENDLSLLQERKSSNDAKPDPIEFNENPGPAPLAPQWQWDPLMAGDGIQLLSIDRLIKGTLPGEFEPQDAIMMSWHSRPWNEPTQLKMIAAIQETTQVVLLVKDDEVREEAAEQLQMAGVDTRQIHFFTIDTDTIWCRDFGPLVVRCKDGAVRIARSMYSESFDDGWVISDTLPFRWSRVSRWPLFQLPVLVEVGALLSNGAGLCIASKRLLAKNAESGIREPKVTAALKRLTGADDVVYLDPINGEATGHVDWFAVFTSPSTIVIGDYYGIDDENARILDENAGRLRGISTPDGPLKVERIPMPPAGDGYFGGTYTNVVFANGNLLVPTWPEASKATEKKALDVYRRLLPDWKIIPIDSQNFGRKFGSLHCATMNLYRYRPPLHRPGPES